MGCIFNDNCRKLQINDYIPALIILLIIVAGMLVCERFFCRFLCPMGAIFSLLPVLPIFQLKEIGNSVSRDAVHAREYVHRELNSLIVEMTFSPETALCARNV